LPSGDAICVPLVISWPGFSCPGGIPAEVTAEIDSTRAASAACTGVWLVQELALMAAAVNARLPAVRADRVQNFFCMTDFPS
jgi:hypothetical protein